MPTFLEALGNVATLPGSSVLDLLHAKNPLDQWMDPLGGSNRSRGADVLESWGLGPGHDALGFGMELATDPFSWMGLGALSRGVKGTKAFKAAAPKARGLWDALRGRGAAQVAEHALAPTAEQLAKREAGMALNRAFGPDIPTKSLDMSWMMPAAEATAQEPMLSRLLGWGNRTVRNPNVRNIAKGGGLLELQSLGRGTWGDQPEYYQQYNGGY